LKVHWPSDWNAVATLAVFIMTLFIQRADDDARSELVQLNERESEMIERHPDDEARKTAS
jgi:hypothetical protein